MDVHPTRANKGFTRKKKRDPVNWKANVAKRARYSPKSLPDRICEHNRKALKCATLTMLFTNIQLLAVKSQPRKHVDVCAVIEGYFAND
ncbi:unnamed protein product [Arctia plantaginis]|uniref:Uncharacterized protein n=1 Tax=Arctia plantaginis TaxID=874455 RepID=A0A8S0Z9K6_ARCPL|nr:unnamed protein product [Arctia plantaginis]